MTFQPHLPGARFSGAGVAGLRVGILGGSFNPAHEGHLHITQLALKRLNLDEVWWMVSPQNPLKSARDMAPFEERMESARRMTRGHKRIFVTDIENHLRSRYTADTVRTLRAAFPRTGFVLLMGADNLQQLPRWEKWTSIFHTVPIAVFDRATYSFKALASKAAYRFRRSRVRASEAAKLPDIKPPAWVYFHTPLHPASATDIRAERKRDSAAQPAKAEADT